MIYAIITGLIISGCRTNSNEVSTTDIEALQTQITNLQDELTLMSNSESLDLISREISCS